MYGDDVIYIIGDARTQEDNPITYQYGKFFVGIIVNGKTGEILDFECSTTLNITNTFLKSIFVGKNILSDADMIEKNIEKRYFGSSRRAILVAYKDAIRKYTTRE